jgi:transposase
MNFAQNRARKRRRAHGVKVGYQYVHSAVDDHTRLAYSEVLPDETAASAIAFWTRAHAFFAAYGITVERLLTDNGACYRARAFGALHDLGITHKRTRAYRPQTNGKVERFHHTLLCEWAYVRPYASSRARTKALTRWLHHYNHHRSHTALGGLAPVTRVTNLPAQHT